MTDDKAREAREARYAEAIYLASDPCGCNEPTPWADLSPARQGWFVSVVAPPVMAVADAEVEAATRELRAEVERLQDRVADEEWQHDGTYHELSLRVGRAEAERDQLRAAMTALADEWDLTLTPPRLRYEVAAKQVRDALARVGEADTQPEGAGAHVEGDDLCLYVQSIVGDHDHPTAGSKVDTAPEAAP